MSATPGTRILNVVDDVIYVEVTGSLSKWNTHTFSVDIQSPGIKKIVLRLKDTVDTVLPPARKYTLEEEALEDVEEASSKLEAAHAALWKAYEGTIGIQETFTRVTCASARLDAVRNKLSLLKDSNDSLEAERVKAEDIDVKSDLTAPEDTTASQYIRQVRPSPGLTTSSPLILSISLRNVRRGNFRMTRPLLPFTSIVSTQSRSSLRFDARSHFFARTPLIPHALHVRFARCTYVFFLLHVCY
ncbi:hypothetical protein EDD15DRAFT_698905 [Pisolithus albus]|nr:hypothetical protein EDD15DRAFT_698905 [Pisolithus albus]